MIQKEQADYVAYLNYFGSMITNDASSTREIKFRVAMEKAAFNKKMIFTSKLELNFRKNYNKSKSHPIQATKGLEGE
jgi:hypothetical protein